MKYGAACQELTAGLREIINIDTGAPAVPEVIKVRDVCRGPQIDNLPDLLVVWNRPAPLITVESPRIGRMSKVYGGIRTGDHTPHCLLAMHGPGLVAGRRSESIPVESIVPTLTELLGVTLTDSDIPSQLRKFASL